VLRGPEGPLFPGEASIVIVGRAFSTAEGAPFPFLPTPKLLISKAADVKSLTSEAILGY
jgi:hypothetical protein